MTGIQGSLPARLCGAFLMVALLGVQDLPVNGDGQFHCTSDTLIATIPAVRQSGVVDPMATNERARP